MTPYVIIQTQMNVYGGEWAFEALQIVMLGTTAICTKVLTKAIINVSVVQSLAYMCAQVDRKRHKRLLQK